MQKAALVDKYGEPATVERARHLFGDLLATASAGTVTLLMRDGWDLAAMVPYDGGPDWAGASWVSATEAKADLGRRVRMAAGGERQVLTRYNSPVAGLVPADMLLDRPVQEHPDPEWLMQNGFHVVLSFFPGEPGSATEDGEVLHPPIDEQFIASVHDMDHVEVAVGAGDSWQEALANLKRLHIYTGPYATEPPF